MRLASSPFHIMAKPAGPKCNLRCSYCFYIDKDSGLFGEREGWRLDEALLERYVQAYIAAQPGAEICFAFQGGEPTLCGVEYFRRLFALQQQYCPPGKTISNALQTNGTLLDAAWGELLAEHKVLVGISLDGPPELHNAHRLRSGGVGSHDLVLRGIEVLKRHGVEFNLLCTVNRRNVGKALEVYRHLRSVGSGFMQFIPIVERLRADGSICGPPGMDPEGRLAPWALHGTDYGDFLCTIWNEWISRDVGRVFVQLFDTQLAIELGQPSPLCVYARSCGRGLAMEADGGVYACDHYVYPGWKRGTLDDDLVALVEGPEQQAFGRDKHEGLPGQCRSCRHLQRCWGACPKQRFARDATGEPGLNHLCPGYLRFFDHAAPSLQAMAQLLRQGRPAAEVMLQRSAGSAPARNAACPCGSGRKYKHCCG